MAISDIYNAVIEIDPARAIEMVNSELQAGTDVTEILNKGLIAPMDEVGDRFAAGDLFIPEMLGAAHGHESRAGGIIKPYFGCSKNRIQRGCGDRLGQGRPSRYREKPGGHDA